MLMCFMHNVTRPVSGTDSDYCEVSVDISFAFCPSFLCSLFRLLTASHSQQHNTLFMLVSKPVCLRY